MENARSISRSENRRLGNRFDIEAEDPQIRDSRSRRRDFSHKHENILQSRIIIDNPERYLPPIIFDFLVEVDIPIIFDEVGFVVDIENATAHTQLLRE